VGNFGFEVENVGELNGEDEKVVPEGASSEAFPPLYAAATSEVVFQLSKVKRQVTDF
jgi:hypothetical protein